ncbi:ATP-binding protein [Fulvivirgaceae bacterium BMA10]|uniref:histidine kinase n=1 Tax=Splendidivirga corallicola TaxID=3051826 RepID=A0ABT8KRM8_9BACT|nr:ATP-binding protein [Fulvivirgaceae bacterium BMA10]
MKPRTKLVLLIVIIHALLVLLLLSTWPENIYLVIAIEIVLLLSLLTFFQLYKRITNPLTIFSSKICHSRHHDFNSRFLKTGQPEMDKLVEACNKMIEEIQKERVHQRQQHLFLDQLIQASPTGIIILDSDQNIVTFNRAALLLFGLNENDITGKKLNTLESKLADELYHLNDGDSKVIQIDSVQYYKCQKSRFFNGGFHHYFIMLQDFTTEMLKTEKVAYEKVIRLMSHEINNSIGAINSILNSALNYKNQISKIDRVDYENALVVAIQRNESLISLMKNFADVVRISEPQKEPYDLNNLLKSTFTLMHPECQKRSIDLNVALSDTPLYFDIDVKQMEQVLLNIIKNSIEAIKKNGEIKVFFTHRSSQIILNVQDNGMGISPEIKHRLFSPFFSTKIKGQGLGLTIIKEILINHDLRFRLETNGHNLTTFQIEFKRQQVP